MVCRSVVLTPNQRNSCKQFISGAYTNQLCTINPHYGHAPVHLGMNFTSQYDPPVQWWLNYTITKGNSALVDGAKRDRLVWSGDISISMPGITVSTYDLISVRNSLDSLFAIQNSTTGQLPYAGRPIPNYLSFTYHLYTLIGLHDFYLYSVRHSCNPNWLLLI
jgi:hypothetical protein